MPYELTHIALLLFLVLVGGLASRRFGQPVLVGYMVAGVIIGPGLLGLQGNDLGIRFLAELAMVLLMFMVGIGVDTRRINGSAKTAILIALAQVALGLIAMLGASFVLGWPLARGVILGFVVSLSSTAVALGMLKDMGHTDTPAGKLGVAILVAQDILVIPMLLAITAFSKGITIHSAINAAIAIAVMALSVIAVVIMHRFPTVVERLEKIFTTAGTQPILAALTLCFGAAAVSGSLGLSTAYGAFAVGLLLGNTGTIGESYRTATHSIHDLLMAVFFLSIGLMLDVRFLWQHLFEVGIILGITLFLKTVCNMFLLRHFGSTRDDAFMLGATLAQIGEFSFVLIALGLSNGFVGRDAYQTSLAVIALSLMLSPLWLSLTQWYLAKHVRIIDMVRGAEIQNQKTAE
ncbi:MAG: cation:proton antiporter [Patescibacteria group bacterium]